MVRLIHGLKLISRMLKAIVNPKSTLTCVYFSLKDSIFLANKCCHEDRFYICKARKLTNGNVQLYLQLDQITLPSHPLNPRGLRPRYPHHVVRTAVSDNGKLLLILGI